MKISPYYTIKNVILNIRNHVETALYAIKIKQEVQLRPAKKSFEIMSVDTIGGFGGSWSTEIYLHLFIDHFTRNAYIYHRKHKVPMIS